MLQAPTSFWTITYIAMNKQNFFQVLTLLLVLINLVLLGFLFLDKTPTAATLLRTVQEEMELSEAQLKLFETSAQKHQRAIEALNSKQQVLIQTYFRASTNPPIAHTDSLEQQIQTIEREKLRLTRLHFVEVKNMLQPAQLAGFDRFTQKAINRILAHQKNN